jgi:hypothetical protein
MQGCIFSFYAVKLAAENDRFPPATLAVEICIPSGQSGGKEVEFDIFCYQGEKVRYSLPLCVS